MLRGKKGQNDDLLDKEVPLRGQHRTCKSEDVLPVLREGKEIFFLRRGGATGIKSEEEIFQPLFWISDLGQSLEEFRASIFSVSRNLSVQQVQSLGYRCISVRCLRAVPIRATKLTDHGPGTEWAGVFGSSHVEGSPTGPRISICHSTHARHGLLTFSSLGPELCLLAFEAPLFLFLSSRFGLGDRYLNLAVLSLEDPPLVFLFLGFLAGLNELAGR